MNRLIVILSLIASTATADFLLAISRAKYEEKNAESQPYSCGERANNYLTAYTKAPVAFRPEWGWTNAAGEAWGVAYYAGGAWALNQKGTFDPRGLQGILKADYIATNVASSAEALAIPSAAGLRVKEVSDDTAPSP